jgi:2-polyprenyl-6-methoxyphenol hydroxylase-like FAD-dependent oxidoreductase
MYDAIVIGSRCAGAPTAMLVARRGRRVLLVDRSVFPSDVLSGHAIQPAGVARLARWGLLDRVRATGVPFTSRVRFDFGPVVLEGEPAPVEGITDTVCIRRTVLDSLLTTAAAEAGVEVRQGFTVKDLVWEDGRVVGIRGRDATGRAVEERAAVVIGADGEHSFVARAVGAPIYHHRPGTTFNSYSYWRGVDLSGVEIYTRPGRFQVAVPTNDDLVIINQAVPVAEAERYRGRVADAFMETLGELPHLAERVAAGERVERFRSLTLGDGFFRQPAGPGWALVGDAGYHKDPITAQGMLDAFRDAELLADGVDAGLEGDMAAEMRDYQRARDEAALPMYEFTCGLAELAPPDDALVQLVGALVGNGPQISRFLGLIAGSVTVPDFLSPDSVAEIMASASASSATAAA